ncbi:MAG TPA: hypothetical protein H9891_00200 [Candidatus Salinicoccus stercoripullorum]|uniref:Uncharacterized protein n=1 Tax=Candidatus Salinicoccus stercoripullorum TaxID=2838756 RepID=A0A9D1QDY0_9STAP|nr:hypothetical protein [Candidatus Salinicoccus stercoripullorum]
MNFKGMKWLNFILTIIALFAIYTFLDGRLNPALSNALLVILIPIGLLSLMPVLEKSKNDSEQ